MRLLDLFESASGIRKYTPMFSGVLNAPVNEDQKDIITHVVTSTIEKALAVSKREDWMVWICKHIRASLASDVLSGASRHGNDRGIEYTENLLAMYERKDPHLFSSEVSDVGSDFGPPMWMISTMKHFMVDMQIPGVQEYRFGQENFGAVWARFQNLEKEWKAKKSQYLHMDDPYHHEEKPILRFPDGATWFDLGRGGCRREGEAMGHCGNGPGEFAPRGMTVLSLRFPVKTQKQNVWRPALTFILDKETGKLGEMKGRNNEKPVQRYHPYIVELLKQPFITGIKGGGYLPENNFDLDDLDPEAKQDLLDAKPILGDGLDYYEWMQKNDLTDDPRDRKIAQVKLAGMVYRDIHILDLPAQLNNVPGVPYRTTPLNLVTVFLSEVKGGNQIHNGHIDRAFDKKLTELLNRYLDEIRHDGGRAAKRLNQLEAARDEDPNHRNILDDLQSDWVSEYWDRALTMLMNEIVRILKQGVPGIGIKRSAGILQRDDDVIAVFYKSIEETYAWLKDQLSIEHEGYVDKLSSRFARDMSEDKPEFPLEPEKAHAIMRDAINEMTKEMVEEHLLGGKRIGTIPF